MKKIVGLMMLMFVAQITNAQINNNADEIDTAKNVVKPRAVIGIASYYSANLDGTKTATGERFYNKNMTAASNNFKLNTWVRVTRLTTNESVIVRINDRMHTRMAKKGRVIDLTRTAARKLNFLKKGLARVRVEEVPEGTEE